MFKNVLIGTIFITVLQDNLYNRRRIEYIFMPLLLFFLGDWFRFRRCNREIALAIAAKASQIAADRGDQGSRDRGRSPPDQVPVPLSDASPQHATSLFSTMGVAARLIWETLFD